MPLRTYLRIILLGFQHKFLRAAVYCPQSVLEHF